MSILQIIFSILGIVLVLVGIYVQLHRRRLIQQVEKLNPIPMTKIPQLIGLNFQNTIEFVRSIADILPVRGWLSPWQMIVAISDPKDVQLVLSDYKVAEKAYVYKFFKNDHGLLSSQHHVWKVHRKIINPAFSIGNIRSNMVPVFREKTDLMLSRMKVIDDDTDCELVHFIKFCLVETSLATFAGQDCDKDVIEEYCRLMTIRIETVARRFLNVAYHWDFLYELTEHHKEEQKCIKFMRGLMKDIITTHPREPTDGRLVLDLLMSRLNDQQITERDVIDELDTIIYTSVDTSTHLIIFTLLMIAMNPQIQEDLVAELQSVFCSPEVPFDYDQLKKLELMERVIKETVRLYPIVPFAVKVAKEPIHLSNCVIPEGVLVLIPIMSIHESPAIWGPNVKVFNPDNFLPENTRDRHPFSFIPFSAGRNCIGMVYGKFMMTSIIARILMEYKIRTTVANVEDIRTEYKITLNLKNKNPFRLTKRTDFYN